VPRRFQCCVEGASRDRLLVLRSFSISQRNVELVREDVVAGLRRSVAAAPAQNTASAVVTAMTAAPTANRDARFISLLSVVFFNEGRK
jgi:hypothetical protein